ncbi:hypothetical protein D3C73_939260 [compost metagenome]
MGHALDRQLLQQPQQRLHIDLSRRQQYICQRSAQLWHHIVQPIAVFLQQKLAHQRKPVAVHTAGCQANDRISRRDIRTCHQLGLVGYTHRESGDIIFTRRIHARHLSRLAADQRAACLMTAFGNPGNNRFDLLGHNLVAGQIIEEEQRLCTLHYNIVHTHGNRIDANRVVAVGRESDFELRAHTIGSRHEHRFFILVFIESEECTEPAELCHHFRTECALHMLLHAFYRFIASCNIHSGVFISFRHYWTPHLN